MIYGMPPPEWEGQAASRSRLGLKQGIGSSPMGVCLVAMGLNPRDLSLQHGDTVSQFVERIAIQTLPGELAGGISAPSGEIVFVHCGAASQLSELSVNGDGDWHVECGRQATSRIGHDGVNSP